MSIAATPAKGSHDSDSKKANRHPLRKSAGQWATVWARFRKNIPAVLALCFAVFLGLVAILSPVIVGTKPIICRYKGETSFPCIGYVFPRYEEPLLVRKELRQRYSPSKLKNKDPESWAVWPLIFQDPVRAVRDGEWSEDSPGNPQGDQGRPSKQNLMGTLADGTDVFAQLVHGTREALLVGFVATGISALIGITIGAFAGYFGGWVDTIVSRIIEVIMCIPALVLILAVIAVLEKPTIWHTMVILGVTSWTGIARLTRAEFLKLRNVDYVAAAKALGAGPLRIIFNHILPNAMAPILVPISFGIAGAVLVVNALAFLGMGAPSLASWGNTLKEGSNNMSMWWLLIFPGTIVFVTVLAYNLIGEGLQEATDPRLRESAK